MKQFGNLSLIVSAMPFPPYVMDHTRNGIRQIYGICGSVLDNVTAVMNISYQAILPADNTWGTMNPDGSYTGMLNDAFLKKADIAFGPFTTDDSFGKDFLISDVYAHIEVKMISGVQDMTDTTFGIFEAFDRSTWIGLLLSVLLLGMAIPFLQKVSNRTTQKEMRTMSFFGWPLITALLGQGTAATHGRQASRLIWAAWLLAGLVLSTYFTSLIVASLTVRTSFAKIDSVEELVKHPRIAPLYPAGTQLGILMKNAKAEAYQKLYDMTRKHRSAVDIPDLYSSADIEAMLQRKAVLIIGVHSAKITLKDICPHIRGRFYIGREPVYVWNSIFVTNKNFPSDVFREINKRVKWWVESGVPALHAYELDPPGGACFASSGSSQRERGAYASNTLRFQDLTGLFFTYIGLSALALVVFGLELWLGRRGKPVLRAPESAISRRQRSAK